MNKGGQYWDERATLGPQRSVVDQNDWRGCKSRYVTSIRDRAFINALSEIKPPARILDFGCGSGNLSKVLLDKDYAVVGVDISFPMLAYTKRFDVAQKSLFLQYDGTSLPFVSNSFDGCVIYEVLMYLIEDDMLYRTLCEIRRVIKPGGRLVAIEQIRRKNAFKPKEMKLQRSAKTIELLMEAAGFTSFGNRIIRRGHFPLIYPINYGLVPPSLFPFIGKVESVLGGIFKHPIIDYANAIFIAEKPLK